MDKALEQIFEGLKELTDGLQMLYNLNKDHTSTNEIKSNKNSGKNTKVNIDDVRKVMAEKSVEGFSKQLREILKKYGVNRLSNINEEHIEAIYQEVCNVG